MGQNWQKDRIGTDVNFVPFTSVPILPFWMGQNCFCPINITQKRRNGTHMGQKLQSFDRWVLSFCAKNRIALET